MKAATKVCAKRIADLEPGYVIVIDRGGHTAVVESNEPDTYEPLRARGYYQTRFLMDDGVRGGWTGNGQNLVTLAATAIGGAL